MRNPVVHDYPSPEQCQAHELVELVTRFIGLSGVFSAAGTVMAHRKLTILAEEPTVSETEAKLLLAAADILRGDRADLDDANGADDDKGWIGFPDVMKRLGMTRSDLNRILADGHLESEQRGRQRLIRASSLDKYLAHRRAEQFATQ